MVIAAYIDSLHLPSSQLFQSLYYLAKKNPVHHFIIFSEKNAIEKEGPANMEFTDVKSGKTSIGLYYWYNIKLPALLKKIKVNVFISDSGICSLNAKIPQWIQVTNTGFLHKNSVVRFDTNAYKRKHFQKFVQTAAGVFVMQEYMTRQIMSRYPAPAEKFLVTGEYFSDHFKPMSWETKNDLLEQLTGGIEYFLCNGMPATKKNITTILKAFSLFKVRLKSSLKLVLALQEVTLEECVKDLGLYKYRQDVVVINEYTKHTYPQLISAAYTVIYMPTEITGYSESGLPALQSGTALITINQPEHHDLYKNAALFSDPNDKSIADNMMQLYKDEALRNTLIQKGLQLTNSLTLPAIAANLWEAVAKP